jgi:hypothetical protein
MGVVGQRHAPSAFPPGNTWYPLYRKLDGPRPLVPLHLVYFDKKRVIRIMCVNRYVTTAAVMPKTKTKNHPNTYLRRSV